MSAKARPKTLWDGTAEEEAIRDRVQLLLNIGKDRYRQAVALEASKRDLFLWIENFVWTFDPRRMPASPVIPFHLFPRQRQYLEWRIERRLNRDNGICEKSRDSGMSWLNICHQVHCWLFESNFRGAFGSRKEDLVDRKGDPDSIFEKIRMLLRHLPKWMLPQDFDWEKHDNFKRLINPNNGSVITGESGDDCGRGGRTAFYDWDEVAFTERPLLVEAALSNNTNCIFYTSSANGHNFFYQKVSNAPIECRFRFHWKDDPRKDESWYKDQQVKFDPVIVASEVDIDYGASVEGIYIPAEWVQAAVDLIVPMTGERIAALDVATTGKNLNVLGWRQGAMIGIVEAWNGIDTTQTAFKVRELMVTHGLKHLNFDACGVGSGVSGTLNSIQELEFTYLPLQSAGRPSDTYWPGERITSKEKFHNARAEWWGFLHERFKKTYDVVHDQGDWPLDELISIPNNPALITQISQPKRKWTGSGKMLIESKDEMRNRGIGSPDHADMLAYLMAPRPDTAQYIDLFSSSPSP